MRQGHAIAMLHGAGGGGWEWALWGEVLRARGFDARAPDLQPAPGGIEATTLADYVVQARDLVLALPRPRAVVGASLGGLLAAACADVVDALVLVNPLPPSPWHRGLPVREWPARVPWARDARLSSTRDALQGADPATSLAAFRRWRDESGCVLAQAWQGVVVRKPACPVLCIASDDDADVPPAATRALAGAWSADFFGVPGGHVAPLLGRGAAPLAGRVAGWLSAR